MKVLDQVLLEQAIDHFGPENQIIKALEELGELSAALARFLNDDGMMLDIVEELADCQIMLGQMNYIFGVDLIEGKIKQKQERLSKMIIEHKSIARQTDWPCREKYRGELADTPDFDDSQL